MAKSISSLLVEMLINAGATHAFGVTGDAINYFVKAINHSDEIEWVGMRHEGNAAFAAYAQAAFENKLGVCAGTVGPGSLHLINGLYSAKKERVPLIAVSGQVSRSQLGSNYFQEADLKSIFDDVCAYQAIIRTPEDAVRGFQKAIKIAISQRTVCRIELPQGLGDESVKNSHFMHQMTKPYAVLHPNSEVIKRAVNLIDSKQAITILAGDGCRKARTEVLQLSEKLNAPIVFTLRSADIFDMDEENVVGQTGLIGNPSGYKAVMNCDLLLMLGTDFPYDEFLPHNTSKIQVDKRFENIGNRTSVNVSVWADVKPTVDLLVHQVQQKSDESFLQKYKSAFEDWRQKKRESFSVNQKVKVLHPQIFTNTVNQHASNDAIFVLETSTAAIWSARTISFHSGRKILGSFNHGSMSVGLPAAIGAQLSHPNREVWALCGDGGFNMSLQDFMTAVERKLPLKIIIFNNSQLNLIKLEMERDGESPDLEAVELKNPDFAAFAKLYGGDGVKVDRIEDIENAILKAKQSEKPFIIDAIVTRGELPFPPHISIKDAIKLTESNIKETVQIMKGDQNHLQNMLDELKSFLE